MAKSVERVVKVASGVAKTGNTIYLASGTAGTGLTYTTGVLSIGTGAITSTMILDGTIANADISASAAIALSKLATDPLARANHTGTQALSTISNAGTAASKNIPATGDASITEVVYGTDTRLTNSRAPSGSAGGDLAGTYPNPTIGTGKVTSTHILDGTIVNADINASAAIALSKLATDPLARANHTGTQTLSTISDAGTAASKNIPATGNASVSEVVYGTDTRLSDSRTPTGAAGGDLTGTYPNPTIASGVIVNADVSATAAIAYSKLNLSNSIVTGDIVDGTIVNADISASAAIALSKLATDPLARANHTGTQTASTISNFDTQVRTSRLDQMAAPTASVSLNSQKITSLATPTATGDAATKGYVDGYVTTQLSATATRAFGLFIS